MMKNRLATAFAFAALFGLAACGTDRDTDVIVEQPVVEEPAPVVTEPMYEQPVVTDTALVVEETVDTPAAQY
jgi:predicted small lipoprotein YifL